ncbi:patatin-like phospholipase family protein [Phenylobacterium sp.]|uniref:patatin-like phospholipase family protein n=1 Tax=Phenylobacterium sp. TaxID=1871053 RepID=UPI0035B33881
MIDCNLVLKGGVTSGLVWAGAFPPLAARYRFRAVAGSSAGAIAAAFCAAAEYARVRGDPAGFERLQARCAELPTRLPDLFQASPPFERLMRALVRLAPGTGRARIVEAVLAFWPTLLAGALLGLLLGAPELLGAVFGAAAGAVFALAGHLAWLLVREAPRHNFGLCSGLSRTGRPALTDWLHDSLQAISRLDRPLTFGDLAGAGIDLRLVTTNLSTSRPEVSPELGAGLDFRPAEWARLFPAEVMTALPVDDLAPIPVGDALPVLVAVRMSLACPALMEAVPAVAPGGARVWFSDGGLTTNFPFELFEADARLTLGLDLDTLHPADAHLPRVRELDPAEVDRPPDLTTLRPFVWSLLVALREGRLRAAARAPGRRARIYQARLTADEGGMNLAMTEGEARKLMDYGATLGAHIVAAEAARAQ